MARKPNLETFMDYGIDPVNRILYFGSTPNSDGEDRGIDFIVAEHIIKGILSLDASATNGDKPINMIINSPGGDVFHGLAIYDAMQTCKNYVSATVFGQASSMASILLQAADERYMTKNSFLMIHAGEDEIAGHPSTVSNWFKHAKRVEKACEDIYLARIKEKKPRYRRNDLQKLLQFDTILTPKEAIALGLADGVLGEN